MNKREGMWLALIALSPITVMLGAYNQALPLLGFIFLLIGLKGIFYDML